MASGGPDPFSTNSSCIIIFYDKSLSPAPEPQTVSSDMKVIYDFLSQKVDVHGARLAPELIDQFVEVVTPIADYSYR